MSYYASDRSDSPPHWLIKRIRKQHKKKRKKYGMVGTQFLKEGRYGDPRYKDLPINPHPHTKIQLKKMTKTGLIRLVIKLEKFIVSHAYEMYKSKLPRLRTTKDMPRLTTKRFPPTEAELRKARSYTRKVNPQFRKIFTVKGKVKKKLTGAAKAKFLARMNKGRRRKGLKPIRSR